MVLIFYKYIKFPSLGIEQRENRRGRIAYARGSRSEPGSQKKGASSNWKTLPEKMAATYSPTGVQYHRR